MKIKLINNFKNHLLASMIVFPFAYDGVPIFVGSLIMSFILIMYQRAGLKLVLDMRLFIYIIFLVWISVSSFIFYIEFDGYELRDFQKAIFPFLYSLLIIRYPLDVDGFEKLFVFYVKLLSIAICTCFSYLYIVNYDALMDGIQSKLWGAAFLPGWPNGLIVPIFFGLYLALKLKISDIWIFCIFAAIYLIFSRAALASALLLFLLSKIFNTRFSFIKIFAIILFSSALIVVVGMYEFSIGKYFYMSDRVDIYLYALSYIFERPFLGFGGKTLDQLEWFNVGYVPLMPWPHTHNFIFEFILRYGLVGACLFFLILMLTFMKLKDLQSRLVFVILIALALFQTHFQEVGYLFLLGFLINSNRSHSAEMPNIPTVNCPQCVKI